MTSSLALRVASVLSLLFAVGHSLGGLSFWSPAGETEVLRAMRTFQFDAAGSSRTYLDFYLGFGYTLSIYLVAQAIALWQLASLARTDANRVRPLIGTFFLASVVGAYLSWRYIFWVPVVSNIVIAACLGLAFHAAGKRADT